MQKILSKKLNLKIFSNIKFFSAEKAEIFLFLCINISRGGIVTVSNIIRRVFYGQYAYH